MWKISGHTLGTPGLSLADSLRLFKAADLDGAEVIWQDGYRAGIPEDDGGMTVAELNSSQREIGLNVIGLTPYMTDLNSLDETKRQHDLDRFRRCMSDAERLGAGVVRVYAGSYTQGEEALRDQKWSRLVDSLRELGPEAATRGVTLVVENHFNTMTMSAADTVALVAETDHPAVRILYDQANLTFTHCEPYEKAVPMQAELIGHVHAKDLVFSDPARPFTASAVATVNETERAVRSRVLGEGELDWTGICRLLDDHGVSGYMSLEYEYRWHPDDLPPPLDGFRRGAINLRRAMGYTS